MSNETQGTDIAEMFAKAMRKRCKLERMILIGLLAGSGVIAVLALLEIVPPSVLSAYWMFCIAAAVLIVVVEKAFDWTEKRRRNGR